ncbi:cell wall binding repeat 2-containing protein [Syntrophobotulus glycolicus DSM 8271]|uniref:Cell wall binding repeat 2-containing protein n=1 Tax=Syntrophobotulus glycolicus (strain DSM 8271 / FlGlyR) TaxID=645991 RepID=F0SU44_SYNGF|nr:cell wall-binding repeat-containing protein [Syntrophobotulus glycolicus]ADY55427.1 cell wall binding repeat 2-containing protein [Syntrophobotulus glycolicus DSM 8271]
MRAKGRKILALLLAACLLLGLLPAAVWADELTQAETTLDVSRLTRDYPNSDGHKWSYYDSAKTLQIYGGDGSSDNTFTLTGTNSGLKKIAVANSSVHLVLDGAEITVSAGSGIATAIYAAGELTVRNGSTVTAVCSEFGYGIRVEGDMNVKGSEVRAEGIDQSEGIYVKGGLTLEDSTVTASSKGALWANGDLYVEGDLTVDHSTLTAQGESRSNGIEVGKAYSAIPADLIIKNGSAVMVSGSPKVAGTAIQVPNGAVSIDGSTVTAPGSIGGIYAEQDMTIENDSTVSASADSISACGICAKLGRLTIKDSAITAESLGTGGKGLQPSGKLTVAGTSTITASGGGSGIYAIGSSLSEQEPHLAVSGGTLDITGGTGAVQWNIGNIVISGGSVKANGALAPAPQNAAGTPVYLTTLTLSGAGAAQAVTGTVTPASGSYSLDGVKTAADGKLYFWLPEGAADVDLTVEGVRYTGNLNVEANNSNALVPNPHYFQGAGTSAEDPYLIGSAAQLARLAQLINAGNTAYQAAYYRLTGPLDLSAYAEGAGWTPIGTDVDNSFRGSFDGNHQTISGLTISRPATATYSGLFGYVRNGTVENLGLTGVNISGGESTGGIAGVLLKVPDTATAAAITNCSVTGTVSGSVKVGGIAGSMSQAVDTASIEQCYVTATVQATGDKAGGIVGDILNGTVRNCYATGTVSGASYAGGIAGNVVPGYLEACYAMGAVNGDISYGEYVGGIAGYWYGIGSFKNCAALNPSVAGKTNVGRVAGNSGGINNHAFAEMSVTTGSTTQNNVIGAANGADLNGANADPAALRTAAFWTTTLGWDGAIWTLANDRAPVLAGLNGQDGALGDHLKSTPAAGDLQFTLPTDHIYTGSPRGIGTVTAKSGVSGLGEITVNYNGSATVPANAGTYAVTADIAAGTAYRAATGVSLGDYTIGKATVSGINRTLKVETGLAASYPFDLTDLLPEVSGLNNVVYRIETVSNSGDGLLSSEPSSGPVTSPLTLEVEDVAEADKTATVSVIVSSDNYEDFTAVITVRSAIKSQVTVTGGSGGGEYASGDTVTLTAGQPPSGKRFKGWSISPDVTFVESTDRTSQTVKFTMPEQAVTATAEFEAIPQSSGGGGGGGSTSSGTEAGASINQAINNGQSQANVTLARGANAVFSGSDLSRQNSGGLTVSLQYPGMQIALPPNTVPPMSTGNSLRIGAEPISGASALGALHEEAPDLRGIGVAYQVTFNQVSNGGSASITQLSGPLTLTFDIPGAALSGIDPASLRVYKTDDRGHSVELGGQYQNGRITVSTSHLCSFFIMGKVAKERISGQDRYETAAAVSQKGWEQAESVVLVSGEAYADALSGSVLAGVLEAPVLLTGQETLNQAALKEIERLQAKTVYIIGGTGSVSAGIETKLKEKYQVERLQGSDRYRTAVAVGAKIRTLQTFDSVILATGENYPDALAVAPFAAGQGTPILFTDGNSLNEASKQALKDWGIQSIVIVGGEGAVTASAAGEITGLGIKAERLSGADRYLTALAVARHYGADTEAKQVVVTTGEGFADALAGAPLAAKNGYPVLLTEKTRLREETAAYIRSLTLDSVLILGGEGAVSAEAADAIK